MASSTLFTPHCTSFTLDKSYSPRRRFRSEGVIHFALRTKPKLLAVARPLNAMCQAGLSRWPIVISQILETSSLFLNNKSDSPVGLDVLWLEGNNLLSTVGPRYNEDPVITSNIRKPGRISKIYGNKPRYNEPCYNKIPAIAN